MRLARTLISLWSRHWLDLRWVLSQLGRSRDDYRWQIIDSSVGPRRGVRADASAFGLMP